MCSGSNADARAAHGGSRPSRARSWPSTSSTRAGCGRGGSGGWSGVDHPLVPMPHHYLVTDDVPAVAAIGGTCGRHRPRGVHLPPARGQRACCWASTSRTRATGRSTARLGLRPDVVPRGARPDHAGAHDRRSGGSPCLQETGIKRWVNGAFTFTPDGNPLVGPVDGVPGYWAACGCMAGFSQGAGDRAGARELDRRRRPGCRRVRDGRRAVRRLRRRGPYLRATTAQFYARRFVMAYPNEELPAGRPLKTTPCYDDFLAADARFTVNWGLEVPLYFAPSADFVETRHARPVQRRADRGRGGRRGAGRRRAPTRSRSTRGTRSRARRRGMARSPAGRAHPAGRAASGSRRC